MGLMMNCFIRLRVRPTSHGKRHWFMINVTRQINLLEPFLAVAVMACGLLASLPAMACSCAAPATPADALARSSAAFAGRVVDIDKPFLDSLGLTTSGLHYVTFEVVRSWKGAISGTVAVRTRLSGEACGYRFEIGQEYLVYTSGDPYLITGICTGTRPTEGAADDIQALDRLASPQSN
jgi:hypothetical protein